MVNHKSIFWSVFAGISLFGFYFLVMSLLQSVSFTLLNLRTWWYLFLPLILGFSIQVGLVVSLQRTMQLTGMVAGMGTFSGGSMLACCSHFLLNIIPFMGISGLAPFFTKYQPWFLGFGILSNAVGVVFLLRHHQKIKNNGGRCHGD